MSDLTLGALYGAVTLVVMFSGMPIAFALGVVATGFMYFFMPASSLDTITQNVYEEMASITLLSIPLFILKGAAIGKSRPARTCIRPSTPGCTSARRPGHRQRVCLRAVRGHGRLSPATCSAIGSAGIPEMRKRGYSPGFAAGIIAAGGTLGILLPPSITMILYAVAAEQSLGRLFLAGIGPGMLLVVLFAGYAVYRARKEYRMALDIYQKGGEKSAYLEDEHFTLREKVEMLPRVLPFIVLLIGVMVALYGGFATPSETAGLGALLALALLAVIYGVWKPKDLSPILGSTIKESTMLMFIIGMSLLYSYVMSYLHISQSAAAWVVSLHLSKWVLLAVILLHGDRAGLLPAAGVHHPDDGADHPAAAQGRRRPDLVRHRDDGGDGDGPDPPAGGPEHFRHQEHCAGHSAQGCHLGRVPFLLLMVLAVLLLCLFPSIATGLPDMIMGAK
jgi:tripartite ATP-independent transporter DctM subunit